MNMVVHEPTIKKPTNPTFSDSTYVGNGDFIIIKNGKGHVIGRYVRNQLAGKKVKIASSRFTVSLHSNNDNSQGWGFAISKIQSIPHSVLNISDNTL